MRIQNIFSVISIALLLSPAASAQSSAVIATVRGSVRIEPSGRAARNTLVTIAELKKAVLTDENGAFEFHDIPAGKYLFIAHLDRVPDVVKTVEVTSGDQTIDFLLTLAAISDQVTVTAT